MRYPIRVSRRQRERIPLLLYSLGADHPQEAIRRPDGFPVWQIFFGVHGSGEYSVDGFRSVLHPGQIAVLPPYTRHGYHAVEDAWTVHYVGFEGMICLKLLSVLRLNEAGVYTLSDPEVFLSHFTQLQTLAREKELDQSACSLELYSMLLDLSRAARRLPPTRGAEGNRMIKEVILYLEDHFSKDVSLDDLSEHFHITPEYLCACFKSTTGETIMQVLKQLRIHHAKLFLLDMPDMSIQEVADACGFHSASYFGKVFHKATGYTPQAYRLGVWQKGTGKP